MIYGKIKNQIDFDLFYYGVSYVKVIKPNFIKKIFGFKKIKYKRLDPTTIRIKLK